MGFHFLLLCVSSTWEGPSMRGKVGGKHIGCLMSWSEVPLTRLHLWTVILRAA